MAVFVGLRGVAAISNILSYCAWILVTKVGFFKSLVDLPNESASAISLIILIIQTFRLPYLDYTIHHLMQKNKVRMKNKCFETMIVYDV